MMRFYICEHCGNIVTFVKSSGVPVMCCGQKMTELVPGTTDAAVEKHVPVIQAEGAQVIVTVGSVEHPMIPRALHRVDRPGDQGGHPDQASDPRQQTPGGLCPDPGRQRGLRLRLLQPPRPLEGLNPVPVKLKRAPGTVFRGRSVIYCSELFSSHFDRR